jgi:hypothetical protein
MAEIESEHQNDKRSEREVAPHHSSGKRVGAKDNPNGALGKSGSEERSNGSATRGDVPEGLDSSKREIG